MTKRESAAYIKVNFRFEDYDPELMESIVALPGVISAEQMYPDDPALYNVTLVVTTPEDSESILEQMTNYEFVEFAELIDEPEVRGKMT